MGKKLKQRTKAQPEMNGILLVLLFTSVFAADENCVKNGFSTHSPHYNKSPYFESCLSGKDEFLCRNKYEDRQTMQCPRYAWCEKGKEMFGNCKNDEWFDSCKAMACVKYAVRSPPCNHACFSNKANKKNNNVPGARCKRQTCMKEEITASGTWEMSDHDRKFVCTFDKQKSLQKWFHTTTKYKNSYRITHPLDKTKKLSRSKAKMRKFGTKRPVKGQPGQFRNAGMGYKAGECWIQCRKGNSFGRIPFKLKCNGTPGPDFGKITFHDWKTDAIVTTTDMDNFNCDRDHGACTTPTVPNYAVKLDCKKRYCKAECQLGYAPKDLRRYKCGQDQKWQIAGKHASNLPDCITCIY